jgi:hypothetical protein
VQVVLVLIVMLAQLGYLIIFQPLSSPLKVG